MAKQTGAFLSVKRQTQAELSLWKETKNLKPPKVTGQQELSKKKPFPNRNQKEPDWCEAR